MAFDPRNFQRIVVTDTCAVWNILSSKTLFKAASNARLTFCITPMVLYECIYKPRKKITEEVVELLSRLKNARELGAFPIQECELEDLIAISEMAPIGLSSGELSCIAMAYRSSTVAVMTDEKQARYFVENKLRLRVETTPRLYGWLHFHRHLLDGDHPDVLADHIQHERRPLTKFFQEAYEIALQYRLIASSQNLS